MIKLYTPAEIKSTSKEGDDEIYEVLVSSGKVDRLGDTINPKGWYLTNYNKNPVILWAHQSGGMFGAAIPPVGQATKTWVKDEEELWQKQIFAPTPLAQELKTLVDGRFLRAQSVGFLPLVEDGEKGNIEIEGRMYRRIFKEELKSYVEKGFVEIAGKRYEKDGQHFDKQELLEVSWVDVPALPTALVAARKMNLALMTKALEDRISEESLDKIETKEGRVLSEKNRKLIDNCLKQMGVAIDVLKELHVATEPEKDITPEVKGRSHDKVKEGRNPELRLMRLADKAVENVLRKLKEDKSGRKVDIKLIRIASKALDAVIIKAKAKR